MILDKYFQEIESLEFQIQLSVLSGIEVLQFALARHATVKGLVAELEKHPCLSDCVYDRIKELLPKAATETDLSYDESIVTYLYCLNETNSLLAHRVSTLIWDTEGLLWSGWLAFQIIEIARQMVQSIDLSSAAGTSGVYRVDELGDCVDSRSSIEKSTQVFVKKHSAFATCPVELSLVS